MKLFVNRLTDFPAKQVCEVLGRCLLDGRKRAKVLDQELSTLVTDTFKIIESAVKSSPGPFATMR